MSQRLAFITLCILGTIGANGYGQTVGQHLSRIKSKSSSKIKQVGHFALGGCSGEPGCGISDCGCSAGGCEPGCGISDCGCGGEPGCGIADCGCSGGGGLLSCGCGGGGCAASTNHCSCSQGSCQQVAYPRCFKFKSPCSGGGCGKTIFHEMAADLGRLFGGGCGCKSHLGGCGCSGGGCSGGCEPECGIAECGCSDGGGCEPACGIADCGCSDGGGCEPAPCIADCGCSGGCEPECGIAECGGGCEPGCGIADFGCSGGCSGGGCGCGGGSSFQGLMAGICGCGCGGCGCGGGGCGGGGCGCGGLFGGGLFGGGLFGGCGGSLSSRLTNCLFGPCVGGCCCSPYTSWSDGLNVGACGCQANNARRRRASSYASSYASTPTNAMKYTVSTDPTTGVPKYVRATSKSMSDTSLARLAPVPKGTTEKAIRQANHYRPVVKPQTKSKKTTRQASPKKATTRIRPVSHEEAVDATQRRTIEFGS